MLETGSGDGEIECRDFIAKNSIPNRPRAAPIIHHDSNILSAGGSVIIPVLDSKPSVAMVA